MIVLFVMWWRCRRVQSSPAAAAAGCHGDEVIDEDEDVAQERRRVLRGSGRRDLLQLRNLSKVLLVHYVTSWWRKLKQVKAR